MPANPRSPESGESTEPVEVVNALRWVAERARDGSTLYLDPADAAVYEAYAACVEALTAELSTARAEVERLTIRDGLYAKLREKIAEYFGGDGGYAVLQDGVYALRKSESTARERADRAEQRETDYLALSSAALLMFAAENRYGMSTPEWWKAHDNVIATMRRVFFPNNSTSTPTPDHA